MDRSALLDRLATAAGRTVVVLGDLMLDEYIYGMVSRISPEAPVPVLEADPDRRTYTPGGAANVAVNLRTLGLDVQAFGIVGCDREAELLKGRLQAAGIPVDGILYDPDRPTTSKTRIVAHNQQVVRVDHESRRPLPEDLRTALWERLRDRIRDTVGALVISDYRKGVVAGVMTPERVRYVRERGVMVTANCKPAHLAHLRGANLITMNEHELAEAVDEPGATAPSDAAGSLRRSLDIDTLIVTGGASGLCLYAADPERVHLDAVPVEVYDTVGAGDTVVTAATAALIAGLTVVDAARVANWAGGAVVRKSGTASVTLDEIRAAAQLDGAVHE